MAKNGDGITEQMIKSLGEASDILDESYKKGDYVKFNQAKKLILQIQDKITEMVR